MISKMTVGAIAKMKAQVTNRISLVGLALILGLAGCGQTSFFEVTVTATNAIDITMIASCQVRVSGAATDSFSLAATPCRRAMNRTLGAFEYGTTVESGMLTFHVDLRAGDQSVLGQGEGSGAIKPGGRQTVAVTVQ